jgi:hypothetical protein
MFKVPFAGIVTSVLFVGAFVLSACGAAPEAEPEDMPAGTVEDSLSVLSGTRYLYRPQVGIQIQSSSGAPQTVGQCCTNPETGVSCSAEPCSQCAGVC